MLPDGLLLWCASNEVVRQSRLRAGQAVGDEHHEGPIGQHAGTSSRQLLPTCLFASWQTSTLRSLFGGFGLVPGMVGTAHQGASLDMPEAHLLPLGSKVAELLRLNIALDGQVLE